MHNCYFFTRETYSFATIGYPQKMNLFNNFGNHRGDMGSIPDETEGIRHRNQKQGFLVIMPKDVVKIK
jgi:hypothetical protein